MFLTKTEIMQFNKICFGVYADHPQALFRLKEYRGQVTCPFFWEYSPFPATFTAWSGVERINQKATTLPLF